MVIGWMRGNERFVSTIEPQRDEKNAAGHIGVKFKEKTVIRQYGLIGSCSVGTKKAIINVQRLYLTMKGFFFPKTLYKKCRWIYSNCAGILRISKGWFWQTCLLSGYIKPPACAAEYFTRSCIGRWPPLISGN